MLINFVHIRNVLRTKTNKKLNIYFKAVLNND